MKITDAAVYPYPCGDTTVRRFALEAKALGFDSIVAMDTPAGSFDGVEVFSGIVIQDALVKDVINRLKRVRDTGTVVSVCARDNGFNRAVIGLKGIHVLRAIHAADKTAFDHVTAKMAADNGVAIDIDLSVLIAGRGAARQRAIHRFRDMLTFERRFEFPVTLSSHARSYLDLRAVREITGLCSLIGIDDTGVEKALGSIGRITAPPEPAVRVVS
ncbi:MULTISPECIES: RNase P subunit p30 family protein [unclassified Methanoregula]|uniref:RNase P subunit p30 family protein n=1 Tax=unclassified Methanoregula TaxID=2649730 RepID=UPI0009D0E5E2|nr:MULTISPECIES: RNase P subunit p30 family protein [unclassified Methanoregula]OPX65530.1 MAG: Ribonuclease P protein component 3 [Methanoregula sp. PtaB.Bin085]OPY35810.1 MAG: Ribonuclease P protein component 3 [Methanoregula sp. PtaU1.Bin006]